MKVSEHHQSLSNIDMTSPPVLNPPGGIGYIVKNLVDLFPDKEKLKGLQCYVSCGAQPNADPHFGTITTFMSAFAVARLLSQMTGENTCVLFDAIDTAPGKIRDIGGVKYQRSLKATDIGGETTADKNMLTFTKMLKLISKMSGVQFEERRFSDFSKNALYKHYLSKIIEQHKEFGQITNPSNGLLRVRFPCPVCGFSEKHGETLKIDGTGDTLTLTASCFDHGEYSLFFDEQYDQIEINSPIRNILRGAIYTHLNQEGQEHWSRVTSLDWAGTFQDQIYFKGLNRLGINLGFAPVTIYTPLITDWSGAKLSKSLYVKSGAYQELPEAFLSYTRFMDAYGQQGLERLWEMVYDWSQDPLKFFRSYSIYAIWRALEKT